MPLPFFFIAEKKRCCCYCMLCSPKNREKSEKKGKGNLEKRFTSVGLAGGIKKNTIYLPAQQRHDSVSNAARKYTTTDYFLTTASESSMPGKKRTRSFAGTSISSRLRGLTPLRA